MSDREIVTPETVEKKEDDTTVYTRLLYKDFNLLVDTRIRKSIAEKTWAWPQVVAVRQVGTETKLWPLGSHDKERLLLAQIVCHPEFGPFIAITNYNGTGGTLSKIKTLSSLSGGRRLNLEEVIVAKRWAMEKIGVSLINGWTKEEQEIIRKMEEDAKATLLAQKVAKEAEERAAKDARQKQRAQRKMEINARKPFLVNVKGYPSPCRVILVSGNEWECLDAGRHVVFKENNGDLRHHVVQKDGSRVRLSEGMPTERVNGTFSTSSRSSSRIKHTIVYVKAEDGGKTAVFFCGNKEDVRAMCTEEQKGKLVGFCDNPTDPFFHGSKLPARIHIFYVKGNGIWKDLGHAEVDGGGNDSATVPEKEKVHRTSQSST